MITTQPIKKPFADSFITWAKYENGIMTVEYAPGSCKIDLVQNYDSGRMDVEIKTRKTDSFKGEEIHWVNVNSILRCSENIRNALYNLWKHRNNFEEHFK